MGIAEVGGPVVVGGLSLGAEEQQRERGDQWGRGLV